jgi:hypothetical protein
MRIHLHSEGIELTSQLQAATHAADAGPAALELVMRDNQISQEQREWLARPDNYLRPIRIRAYWPPPRIEENEMPLELELALSRRR